MSDVNRQRMEQIRANVGDREPRFRVGQTVIAYRLPDKPIGVIDAIFADYDAVVESSQVHRSWYEQQEIAPATPKNEFWYGIILPSGAIVQGDLDLIGGMDVSVLAAVARDVLGENQK